MIPPRKRQEEVEVPDLVVTYERDIANSLPRDNNVGQRNTNKFWYTFIYYKDQQSDEWRIVLKVDAGVQTSLQPIAMTTSTYFGTGHPMAETQNEPENASASSLASQLLELLRLQRLGSEFTIGGISFGIYSVSVQDQCRSLEIALRLKFMMRGNVSTVHV